MCNYLHYITIMWRLRFSCAAGMLCSDVICIFKHSCGMVTDTSQAHANRFVQYDTTLLCTSFTEHRHLVPFLKSYLNALDWLNACLNIFFTTSFLCHFVLLNHLLCV